MVEIYQVISIAESAGKVLQDKFYSTHDIQFKDKNKSEIITELDKKIEELIQSELNIISPEYGFLGEEGGLQREGEYKWIVDPIDGTTNFSINNPFFNISIALVRNDQPILGIVHVPITGATYFAEKGKGAWFQYSNKTTQTNVKFTPLNKSVWGFCHVNNLERTIKLFGKIKPKVHDARKFGAGALEMALVGGGSLNGFIDIGVRPWDVAAGILLVEEAGGLVTDFKGNKFSLFEQSSDLLATSKELHPQLLEILKDI
ncbi:inositol monophosphatase [Candidatus Micrarchaeota archaeon]|nr:inositol monophosphatase [Candidatus Micrarchaeota archaeon]